MKLLIYGSKSFANTVAAVTRECGHDIAGFVDDFSSSEGVLGGLASVSQTHPPSHYGMLLAIGYNNLAARWIAWTQAKAMGYFFPPLIHPAASIAPSASLLEGSIVMRASIVDHEAIVGEGSVIWPGACVSHNSTVGCNTFVSPGAIICGDVRIGNHSFIGANATVVDGSSVPEGSFIRMHEAYTGRKS